MRRFTILMIGTFLSLSAVPAYASPDDASTDGAATTTIVEPDGRKYEETVTTLPAENSPTQTTVIVPAARDAITNEVVPAEVPKAEEEESLRDKVRSKLKEKDAE